MILVESFVSDIFDLKSPANIPSNLTRLNNHLKRDDEKYGIPISPEKAGLNSGPENPDSDPVSKSPESK